MLSVSARSVTFRAQTPNPALLKKAYLGSCLLPSKGCYSKGSEIAVGCSPLESVVTMKSRNSVMVSEKSLVGLDSSSGEEVFVQEK